MADVGDLLLRTVRLVRLAFRYTYVIIGKVVQGYIQLA